MDLLVLFPEEIVNSIFGMIIIIKGITNLDF